MSQERRAGVAAAVTPAQQARVLHAALPYVQSVQGKAFVVACGGQWLGDRGLVAGLGRDVALLHLVGLRLVLVCGGTKAKPAQALSVRRDLIGAINQQGCRAVGLSEQDGGGSGLAEGLVQRLHARGFVPVILALADDGAAEGSTFGSEAIAGRVAQRLGAEKLLLLGDSPGLVDEHGGLIATISARDTVFRHQGAGPSSANRGRLAAAFDALAHGVRSAHFVDGRDAHALLLEVLSNSGDGTTVLPERAPHFLDDSLRYLNRS